MNILLRDTRGTDPLVHVSDTPFQHRLGLRTTRCGTHFRNELFSNDYAKWTGLDSADPATCLRCIGIR